MSVSEAIRHADENDPLRPMRGRFELPDHLIYLDGNSLGALPKATADRVAQTISVEWARDLITSWNRHDWIGAPQRVGAKIARLIGAQPDEVVVADSTSANVFKLLVAAIRAQQGRQIILTEPGNFPTDLYVAQGVAELFPSCQVVTCPADRIIDAIDDSIAVVMLTHVHYKTGRRLDMSAITAAAHRAGALILWDLSHSAGAIPVDLGTCGADLAVGCGYKYLNGGPGAPAFLYVRQTLQPLLRSPICGWMGHASPFDFSDDYLPAPGLDRFLCGTPPILGLAALEAGVDLQLEAPLPAISDKAEALTQVFMDEVERRCGAELTLVTPRRFADRGSHVSLSHPNAFAICQALIARRVIGDYRDPNILRFGFAPLYTSFSDAYRAALQIEEVLASREWLEPRFQVRPMVT